MPASPARGKDRWATGLNKTRAHRRSGADGALLRAFRASSTEKRQRRKLARVLPGEIMLRILIAAALFAGAASAQDLDCKNPRDQHSMNICAQRDFETADGALNGVYGELMKALDDDTFRTKLKFAQRAWIQFRDTECTFETADNEGGSLHPLVFAGCKTRLTRVRTMELKAFLACQKTPETCGM